MAPAELATGLLHRRWVGLVLGALLLALLLLHGDSSAASASGHVPAAWSAPPPCTGPDCLPQPDPSPAPPDVQALVSPQLPDGGGLSGPAGVSGWVARGVAAAIGSFFQGLISSALNPLLDLLGHSLLATPTPSSLPRVGQLWAGSWQITLACYGLLVMLSGLVMMTHGSIQSRYSLRELGPRIPLGFLAAALSLFFAQKAVELANALTQAVLGEGLEKKSAGAALRDFVLANIGANTNIFMLLLWGLVALGLLVLLLTYVVRIALTVLLIAGAPLALMCHALPQTDGVARWWWRLFGGVLAIQVVQSLALVVALRVFLTPGGFSPFGPTHSALINALVALALLYILVKIPFWVLRSVRTGRGHSLVGRLVRAVVAYKTFGLLRGTPSHARGLHSAPGRQPPPPSSPRRRGGKAPWPPNPARPGSGPAPGAGSGTSSRPGSGSGAGPGTGAGSRPRPGAGARPGSSSGSGARPGAGPGSGPSSGSGSGSGAQRGHAASRSGPPRGQATVQPPPPRTHSPHPAGRSQAAPASHPPGRTPGGPGAPGFRTPRAVPAPAPVVRRRPPGPPRFQEPVVRPPVRPVRASGPPPPAPFLAPRPLVTPSGGDDHA